MFDEGCREILEEFLRLKPKNRHEYLIHHMESSRVSMFIDIPLDGLHDEGLDGDSVAFLEGDPVLGDLPHEEGVGEQFGLGVGGVGDHEVEELEEAHLGGLAEEEGDLVVEVGHFGAVEVVGGVVEEGDVGLREGLGLGEAVQEGLELVQGGLAHWESIYYCLIIATKAILFIQLSEGFEFGFSEPIAGMLESWNGGEETIQRGYLMLFSYTISNHFRRLFLLINITITMRKML